MELKVIDGDFTIRKADYILLKVENLEKALTALDAERYRIKTGC